MTSTPIHICFIGFLLFLHFISNGQVDEELSIINELKSELLLNENIREVNLVHSHYENGVSKELCLGVKFKTDTTNLWWLAGPYYMFHENGNLKCYATSDTKTGILYDTYFLYNENGDVIAEDLLSDTCKIFLPAFIGYDDKNKDTILTHYPNARISKRFKYKGDKVSSVKSRRIVYSPPSRELHGANLKYNYRKGHVRETIYEIGEVISESTQAL